MIPERIGARLIVGELQHMTPPVTSALSCTLKQLAANAHGAKLGCDTDAHDSARHRRMLFRRDDDSGRRNGRELSIPQCHHHGPCQFGRFGGTIFRRQEISTAL